MSKREWAFTVSSILGALAFVFTAFPALSPFAPAVSKVQQAAVQVAEAIPGKCEPSVCAFDPRDGHNHVTGWVRFEDGGMCECLK